MSEGRDITEGLLQTDRLPLYHARLRHTGAPRVLLLGGSNFDLRLKRSVWETPIAGACDIATFEPRGIGRTGRPEGAWTMQDYARDALAFMDALGWSDAIVLGESFGGMTALHLALLAPERVRAMIIASATAGGPTHASYDISEFLGLGRDAAAKAAMFLQDTRMRDLERNDPSDFKARLTTRIRFETDFRDPSIESGGYAQLLEARAQHDCTADLHRISTPTTVIAGRYDQQARPASQRALADALPNSLFRAFDGGHGLLFTHSEACAFALRAIQLGARQPDHQENSHHE